MKSLEKKSKSWILFVLGTLLIMSTIFCFMFRGKISREIKNLMRGKTVWGTPNVEQDLTDGIPIVVTTDDGYAFQTLVTITSVLKNASKETFFKIDILTPNDFKQESKDMILSAENYYKNKCKIEFISMNDCFEESFISKQFSKVVYYRLRIPTILSQRKKCIYIDVDTIVNGDLKELYNIDLKGNWIAGAADACRAAKDEKERREREAYKKEIELKDLESYINSGVLIWDIEAIRENKVEEKFCEFIKTHRNIKQHDQTIINVSCYGKILTFHLKYNLQTYMYSTKPYGQDEHKISEIFSEEEWREAWKNPFIIHYAGEGEKPWNFPLVYNIEKWWEVAKETSYFEKFYEKALADKKANK